MTTKQVLTRKDYMNGEYQREVDQFVRREVIYCVSSLMDEMFKNEKCMDELLETFSVQDYETAVWEHLNETQGKLTAIKMLGDLKEAENLEDYANDHDIEPYEQEIFEYWIVSGWLGEKLQEHGEAVLMDHEFLPTPIWGRTTTGQGIAGDEVIMTIYDELHKQSA